MVATIWHTWFMKTLIQLFQIAIAVGISIVWLVRPKMPTPYRGGNSDSLKGEFVVYGLPRWSFYAVGTLKLLSAALLIAGLWIPSLACGAAVVMAGLMVGAVAMHVKVKDPPMRMLPAVTILTFSIIIAAFYFFRNS
jgi:hypothetical protein